MIKPLKHVKGDLVQPVINKMTKFTNPIIEADYSDPDLIKCGDYYLLVSSSFNYVPALPILITKDLVHYRFLSYALEKLPDFYNEVREGNGVWAPSFAFHNNTYYLLIPFPDKGIFVLENKDPLHQKWTNFRPLFLKKGIEDPTVIWVNNQAYLIFGFVKSRIGFNSKLGIIKVNEDLTDTLQNDYEILIDGTNKYPTIEGPKIYNINNLFHIFAPANGVKHGYQLDLISENIYGPYKGKIILKENGNGINGPHQGGLVHLQDDDFAFIHFSEDDYLGRNLYLERCILDKDNFFTINNNNGPIYKGEINTKEDDSFLLEYKDDFNKNHLSNLWQFPANILNDFYKPSIDGLTLIANKLTNTLEKFPYILTTKFPFIKFEAELIVNLQLENFSTFSFLIIGEKYPYLSIYKENDNYSLYFNNLKEEQKILLSKKDFSSIKFKMSYTNKGQVSFNTSLVNNTFTCFVKKQMWIGLRLGITIYSKEDNSKSKVILKEFKMRKIK